MGVFLGISIHALLAESDSHTFNLTRFQCYFYPRSPCGERLASSVVLSNTIKISIHALLAESDRRTFRNQQRCSNFYPRSPCGERQRQLDAVTAAYMISIHALLAESDGVCNQKPPQARKFLSTLSLRRATGIITTFAIIAGHFYPRSPCGERLQRQIEFERYSDISIHALLAESDAYCINDVRCIVISIHALLAESDWCPQACAPNGGDFYPRSPCGERHFVVDGHRVHITNFYPRSPCGERQGTKLAVADVYKISIHALLAESDDIISIERCSLEISIHALLAESDG